MIMFYTLTVGVPAVRVPTVPVTRQTFRNRLKHAAIQLVAQAAAHHQFCCSAVQSEVLDSSSQGFRQDGADALSHIREA